MFYLLVPSNNRERQINNAIKWLGESVIDDNINSSFFKAMIALESVAEVLPDKGSSPSITEQVSTMISIVVQPESEKREKLKRYII